MVTIEIDANNFNTLDDFYKEVSEKLITDSEMYGNNLNAFNDILRGGFGKYEYGENITLIWRNHKKSIEDFGYKETGRVLQKQLKVCHSSNLASVQKDLLNAQNECGDTLFDWKHRNNYKSDG